LKWSLITGTPRRVAECYAKKYIYCISIPHAYV